MDEPRRLDRRAAARLRATGQDRVDARTPACPIRRARCTASSSTRRSCTRRPGATSCATSSWALPAPGRPGRRRASSTRPSRRSARQRRRRQGHLRAVRRCRLGRRGDAGPSRGRRPADVHLRRPRPDAQARVGAAARDVREEPGHEPGHGRCARRASSRASPASRSPSRSAGSSATSSSASSRRRPTKLGPDRLPDPGHALPGRDRSRRRPRRRPRRRSRRTTTSAGCPPTCASSSSSRCATCSRTRSAWSARSSGCPKSMVRRQPFPGPGLAIRIIGEVTAERLDTLREADWIVIDEIKAAGLYRQLWQSFAILTPVRSVGVMGDGRTYANVVAVRAVTSRGRHDGRLGQAALRRAGQDLEPHRQRGPGRQPGRLRHLVASRPPRSSGSRPGSTRLPVPGPSFVKEERVSRHGRPSARALARCMPG